MADQVKILFGEEPDTLEEFSFLSQGSQAEAKKFFIEHMRVNMARNGGVIWWNLIDGWPQISDAIVDWYGTKKLAYSYIKRSQQPFCMMFDEPDELGKITLVAANDSRQTADISYKVTEMHTNTVVLEGKAEIEPDTALKLEKLPEGKPAIYLIEWSGTFEGKNHFTAAIGDGITLDKYLQFMKDCGFYSGFEGFN